MEQFLQWLAHVLTGGAVPLPPGQGGTHFFQVPIPEVPLSGHTSRLRMRRLRGLEDTITKRVTRSLGLEGQLGGTGDVSRRVDMARRRRTTTTRRGRRGYGRGRSFDAKLAAAERRGVGEPKIWATFTNGTDFTISEDHTRNGFARWWWVANPDNDGLRGLSRIYRQRHFLGLTFSPGGDNGDYMPPQALRVAMWQGGVMNWKDGINTANQVAAMDLFTQEGVVQGGPLKPIHMQTRMVPYLQRGPDGTFAGWPETFAMESTRTQTVGQRRYQTQQASTMGGGIVVSCDGATGNEDSICHVAHVAQFLVDAESDLIGSLGEWVWKPAEYHTNG